MCDIEVGKLSLPTEFWKYMASKRNVSPPEKELEKFPCKNDICWKCQHIGGEYAKLNGNLGNNFGHSTYKIQINGT